MDFLYLLSTAALVALSVIGTLSHRFDDNLLQRIGMALICLGGATDLWAQWCNADSCNPRALMVAGCALFGFGVVFKTWIYSTRSTS